MLVGADEAKMEKLREAMLALIQAAGTSSTSPTSCARRSTRSSTPIIFAEALELFDEHHAAGRHVVIVSSAPVEVVEPLGEFLGVDEVDRAPGPRSTTTATTRASSSSTRTARTRPTRSARSRRARASTSSASYAYSDSITDLPMLEPSATRSR